MTVNCFFCGDPISNDLHNHHPDKEHFPNWTEPAHEKCHIHYHSESGHFKDWGAISPYAGRDGYERAIAKYPAFHSMGGKVRARTAKRNSLGQFISGGNNAK